MALNQLTLQSSTGVQGSPFKSAVLGMTPGTTIEITNDSVPGMGYANGFVYHQSLPYSINGVGLIERVPGTAQSMKSNNVIAATNPTRLDFLLPAQALSLEVASQAGVIGSAVRNQSLQAFYTLVSGSDGNLSISSTGDISALAPIPIGTTQTAIVREALRSNSAIAVQYPVSLTARAPLPVT